MILLIMIQQIIFTFSLKFTLIALKIFRTVLHHMPGQGGPMRALISTLFALIGPFLRMRAFMEFNVVFHGRRKVAVAAFEEVVRAVAVLRFDVNVEAGFLFGAVIALGTFERTFLEVFGDVFEEIGFPRCLVRAKLAVVWFFICMLRPLVAG